MTETQALTKTLVFPLYIQSGDESLLHDARLECRRIFNEVLRLNYDGWGWDRIEDVVKQNADLVQNTAQGIIDKAFDPFDNYYDNDDWGRPWYKQETFPLRMNYGEGYNLFLQVLQDERPSEWGYQLNVSLTLVGGIVLWALWAGFWDALEEFLHAVPGL